LSVELLPIKEARESEPLLAEDLWGAAYCREDAQVNPIRVAQGFAQAASRLGAQISPGVEATGLLIENGRVCGVKRRKERCEPISWSTQPGYGRRNLLPLMASNCLSNLAAADSGNGTAFVHVASRVTVRVLSDCEASPGGAGPY